MPEDLDSRIICCEREVAPSEEPNTLYSVPISLVGCMTPDTSGRHVPDPNEVYRHLPTERFLVLCS